MIDAEESINKGYDKWRKKRIKQGKNVYPIKVWLNDVVYPQLLEELEKWGYPDLGVTDLTDKIDMIQKIIEYRREWDDSEDLDILDELCDELLDTLCGMIESPQGSYPILGNN